jgi:hypothetical protein
MHGAQLVEPDVEEVAHLREPAELAVLDSPPIGRFEASDSHGVIVTCFGSDDGE